MSLNIGVIGTGAIGQDHIRRCSKVLQGSRIVAVTDINRESATKVIRDLGIEANVYTENKKKKKNKKVEAMLIT